MKSNTVITYLLKRKIDNISEGMIEQHEANVSYISYLWNKVEKIMHDKGMPDVYSDCVGMYQISDQLKKELNLS